ncbi:MAG: hypothetical protein LBI95_02240 [Holosporales bacterium]|nr:hypothetical protein [Holosporales bacterium]
MRRSGGREDFKSIVPRGTFMFAAGRLVQVLMRKDAGERNTKIIETWVTVYPGWARGDS